MRSNYKKLGQFIREVSVKNKNLSVELLLGVSITKQFIPSIANTVGTDMSNYKVVEHHQFAYGPVTSRNGEKISVALLGEEKCIVSTSYTVFEIVDTELLDPEYLMMWFRRSEFDRYARYMSHGTVRELFGWQEMCDVELPVPSIEQQREIVREYNVVNDRIALNEQLTQKLENTAQAIYKHWFVDFEFPISKEYAESIGNPELEGKPYKSSGGEMEFSPLLEREIPEKWSPMTLGDVLDIKHGFAFKGDYFTDDDTGEVLLTPGNIKIGGGVKLDKVRFYSGDVPQDYVFEAGDIMVTMTDLSKASDTLGFPAIIPQLKGYNLLHNQRLGKVELKSEFEYKEYIYQVLCSIEYRNEIVGGATGTTVKHTSPTKIMLFRFAKSPDKRIYSEYCRAVTPIETLKESLALEIIELKKISGLLLTKISKMV
ncbi:restriction endonuclease subunit S [Vibrio aestuarianus]|uniref:restriction endonuclease subunit S n=1 Tax=Vibrio aestuarianus TaxID=28171 RepID=UPI0015947E4C|nr:restriction endonuclease subunit S [Vibrio aestuarianus]MDE1235930.1 restriction endonuclease subunit S [Vibrio aestuarianus]MDE1246808.1 restriction endonuclease subunit S [Vibrio aestuarianus]NGZ63005.1 restriction endonuclease subunit S [Vibrio aestuarianus subsp. cardii]